MCQTNNYKYKQIQFILFKGNIIESYEKNISTNCTRVGRKIDEWKFNAFTSRGIQFLTIFSNNNI